MADAPVCHVSPDQVINQPPVKQLPAIPQATDLNSALAAINAMRLTLQMMLDQAARKTQKDKVGRYVVREKAEKKVRVYNKDDHEQYVDVMRTNKLVMQDTVTGEYWTYIRGPESDT
jgi:hypothetical protein